jgi:short-subunit dehydrogenase
MAKRRGLESNCIGIITGASSGIGKAMALDLASQRKARLVICARSADDLEATKRAVEERGGRAEIICGDLAADPHLVGRLAKTALDSYGQIDFIVNNAGLGHPGTFIKLTPEDWDRVFRVNFFAPLYLTYEVLPHFVKQRYGKIVNIASVAGKVAFPGSVCYASSKFALTGFSEGLATEVTQMGIDVLTVCPGWVRTEFFEKNQMAASKNPTLIAQKNDLRGFLMRSVLSMSCEDASRDIIHAMQKGGSHELIMTGPGVFAERFKGLFPGLLAKLLERAPLAAVDSSTSSSASTER